MGERSSERENFNDAVRENCWTVSLNRQKRAGCSAQEKVLAYLQQFSHSYRGGSTVSEQRLLSQADGGSGGEL